MACWLTMVLVDLSQQRAFCTRRRSHRWSFGCLTGRIQAWISACIVRIYLEATSWERKSGRTRFGCWSFRLAEISNCFKSLRWAETTGCARRGLDSFIVIPTSRVLCVLLPRKKMHAFKHDLNSMIDICGRKEQKHSYSCLLTRTIWPPLQADFTLPFCYCLSCYPSYPMPSPITYAFFFYHHHASTFTAELTSNGIDVCSQYFYLLALAYGPEKDEENKLARRTRGFGLYAWHWHCPFRYHLVLIQKKNDQCSLHTTNCSLGTCRLWESMETLILEIHTKSNTVLQKALPVLCSYLRVRVGTIPLLPTPKTLTCCQHWVEWRLQAPAEDSYSSWQCFCLRRKSNRLCERVFHQLQSMAWKVNATHHSPYSMGCAF